MTKFQEEITKAKKLFNIKDKNLVLNKRIAKVVNDSFERNPHRNHEKIHAKCYDIFYLLDNHKSDNNLTPFKLYKIFRLCLYGLDELLFFEDTVNNPKDFSYKKYRDIIERAEPFIINYEDMKVRIPRDPNDAYNEIYFTLLNKYRLKKEDVLNLLGIIYERGKKAKPPKRTIKELEYLREMFHGIITKGGKEKGLSKEEIQAKINEADTLFNDYL